MYAVKTPLVSLPESSEKKARLSSWSTQWLPTFVLSREALLSSKPTFSGLSPPGGRASVCWVRSPELRVIGIWIGRERGLSSTCAFSLCPRHTLLLYPCVCYQESLHRPRLRVAGCRSPPLAEPTRVSRRGMPATTEQHSPQTMSYPPFKKPPQTLSASQLQESGSLSECSVSFLPFPLITLVILLFPPKLSRCFISFASRETPRCKVFFSLFICVSSKY